MIEKKKVKSDRISLKLGQRGTDDVWLVFNAQARPRVKNWR